MGAVLTSKDIIYKQPGEVLNVAMDFAEWLNTVDIISSPVVTVEPDGVLTISNESVSGQKATMTIAGGNDGGTYRVQVQVSVNNGQTLQGDGKLKVRER